MNREQKVEKLGKKRKNMLYFNEGKIFLFMVQLAHIQTERVDVLSLIQNSPLAEEQKKYWREKVQRAADKERNVIVKLFLDEKSAREDADTEKKRKYQTAKETLVRNLQHYEQQTAWKSEAEEQHAHDKQKADELLQDLNRK